MFRWSSMLKRSAPFRPTQMRFQVILSPLLRKGEQKATLDPSLRKIPQTALDALIKGLPAVGHSIVWEYFYQLAEKYLEIEHLQSVINADGESPMSKYRNKSGAPFDQVSWNQKYSWELDFALSVHKKVCLIIEAVQAREQAVSSGGADEELMVEMANEDITVAIESLKNELSEMENFIARRIDESDEWSKASNVWTFETLGRAGGLEATLFAKDLLEYYKKAFDFRGWKVEDLSDNESQGGKLRVEGEGIYPILKHEVGTHRVQRVPVTDAAGKMQTSTCSVFLMPQPSAVSVDIKESDCKFEFVRGSGPGGQGMQSSSNCCVMTHIPTGYTFKVHQARSAASNKALALEMLAQRMWRDKHLQNDAYQNSLFEKQWSSGERGEKIRTYNYPQNRVTEHRLPADVPLTAFMEGTEASKAISDRLVEEDRREQLSLVLSKHIASGFSS